MVDRTLHTIVDATLVSSLVVTSALALVLLLSVPVAYLVTSRKRSVRLWLDTLFTVPMVLPPTAIGFGLLWLFGRNGPLGYILANWMGISLLFTSSAAILAAFVVSFPLVYRSARASFDGIDRDMTDTARTLRTGEAGVFFRVSLPLARRGILVGAILGFARAMGEFGATLMIAGNIPGRTQTLPMAIYQAVQAGQEGNGLVLCLIAASIGVAALVASERLEPGRQGAP